MNPAFIISKQKIPQTHQYIGLQQTKKLYHLNVPWKIESRNQRSKTYNCSERRSTPIKNKNKKTQYFTENFSKTMKHAL